MSTLAQALCVTTHVEKQKKSKKTKKQKTKNKKQKNPRQNMGFPQNKSIQSTCKKGLQPALEIPETSDAKHSAKNFRSTCLSLNRSAGRPCKTAKTKEGYTTRTDSVASWRTDTE
jgi:hypothetical protein